MKKLLAIWLICSAAVTISAADKPNIVLIMTDDMGYSDIGCYGGEIETPNLDMLAKNGVHFSQFYNTSRCSPTRSSLISGLYSHQAGMGLLTNDQGEHNPGYRGRLMERCVTIAEVLRPQGYLSIATGKWHMGHDKKEWWPLGRGFDRFYGCPQGGGFFFRPSSWGGRTVVRGDEVIYDKERDPAEGWYTTDAWTDEGLKYVEEAVAEKKPFFWYLAHNAPHFPLQAKPEDIAKYRGKYKAGWDVIREQRYERLVKLGLIDKNHKLAPRHKSVPAWDSLSEEEKDTQDERMAIYAAMVDCVDQNVGKIIDSLKRLGVYDNTLIIFLSDNGGQAEPRRPLGFNLGKGAPGTVESKTRYGTCWANVSSAPFRKFKNMIHEGGIATPLIAHWPKGISASIRGSIIKQTAHVIDIMPTLVELSGAQYPDKHKGHEIIPMEGVSLKPLFDGGTIERSDAIYFEHTGKKGVRDGKWKLVSAYGLKWELYDMENDRTELNDLASKMPEKKAELAKMWEAWAARCFVKKGKKPNK